MSQDSGSKWDKLDLPTTQKGTRSTQRRTNAFGGDGSSGKAIPDNTKNKWSNLEEPVVLRKKEKVYETGKWSNLEEPVVRKKDEPCDTGKWNDLEVPEGRPRKGQLEPSQPNKWSDIPSEYNGRSRSGFGPKPIQSYGPAMRTQDPQHIIGQQAIQSVILRKNALSASIEQAIITHKQEPVVKPAAIPIVTPKPKPMKKKQASLDDLDQDEDERKAIAAVAKARLAAQVESEESEDEVEDEGEKTLTKAERKAAKHEAKKKRLIAAGLGHMYDHH